MAATTSKVRSEAVCLTHCVSSVLGGFGLQQSLKTWQKNHLYYLKMRLSHIGFTLILILFAPVFCFCPQGVKSVGRAQSSGEQHLQVGGGMVGSHQNGPIHRDLHGERIQFNGCCGSGDHRVSSIKIIFTSFVGVAELGKTNVFRNMEGGGCRKRSHYPFFAVRSFSFTVHIDGNKHRED